MSISSTAEPSQQFASGVLTTLAAATKRLFVAYMTWRMERSAIAVLRTMSDRELRDIGLSRSDIESAVGERRPAVAPSQRSSGKQRALLGARTRSLSLNTTACSY